MRVRFLTVLLIAAAVLAGCETTPGPTANCFSLAEGGCDFRPVSGAPGAGR